MLKGVNLQLYIGPLAPIPAPRIVMEALSEVSVTIRVVATLKINHLER